MALDLNIGFPIAGRQGSQRANGASASLLPYRSIAAIALLAHMTCLWLVGEVCGGGLAVAQTLGVIAGSMTIYGIEALLSYRRRGPWRWYLGLLPFLVSCGAGMAGSVLLALWLAGHDVDWFIAGLCGAAAALWWNAGAVDRHGWSAR
jgi:putative flippase GtrA